MESSNTIYVAVIESENPLPMCKNDEDSSFYFIFPSYRPFHCIPQEGLGVQGQNEKTQEIQYRNICEGNQAGYETAWS